MPGKCSISGLLLHYDSVTDVGRVRNNNEDQVCVSEPLGLFGVFDGLGGHAAGEVASRLACETLTSFLEERRSGSDPAALLGDALVAANQRLLQEQSENSELSGMGTTASVLWFYMGSALIGHIGDSRVYLIRDGAISQVTEDHSPVFRLYRQGVITKDQILLHPRKNLVDRSLGISLEIEPEVESLTLRAGDKLLACTDGLTDLLTDGEIESVLLDEPFEEACQALAEAANHKGGFDNISLVLVSVEQILLDSTLP